MAETKKSPPATDSLPAAKKRPIVIGAGVGVLVVAVAVTIMLLPPSLSKLSRQLARGNTEQQMQALKILEKYGAEATPVLVQTLNTRDYTVRERSVRLLRKIGMPAVPELLAVVEDETGAYNELARVTAIKILGGMKAQEAEKPIYQLAIAARSSEEMRRAAIENLLAIAPRYEKYYSLYDGVWYANSELEKKGFIKIGSQWVSLDSLIEKTRTELATAKQALAELRQKNVERPATASSLIPQPETLPQMLAPWQACLRKYQVLDPLRPLWPYEAGITRVQTALAAVQSEVGQGVVEVCTELQEIAKRSQLLHELYAAEVYAAASDMCTQAQTWPWSPACQERQKIEQFAAPMHQELATLQQKLQSLVVVSCTGCSDEDKVIYEFKELLTYLFKRHGRLPVFRAPLSKEEQQPGITWFFCHYQEDTSHGEAVCGLSYWLALADGESQNVWSQGFSSSIAANARDRDAAMGEARLTVWKKMREWKPDWNNVIKSAANRPTTTGARVAGSTLYKQTASDIVQLKDGRVLQGLIETETADAIELVYVERPSREQQIVAKQKIERSKIANIERIADDVRKFRLNMVKKSKKSGREQYRSVKLRQIAWEFSSGSKGWEYGDDLFVLDSNADQEFVKHVATRVREIFNAYQQFFAVTRNVERKLKIFIFNSSGEYQAAIGGQIKNPAFYWPEKNYIVAGCDLYQYRQEVAQIRSYHDSIKTEIARRKKEIADFEQKMRSAKREEHSKLDKALKSGQIQKSCYDNAYRSIREWEEQQNSALREYQKQLRALEDQILNADYQNMKLIDKYAGDMLKLLYHEAFHAFLRNFLFAEHEARMVPLWLNEGMAQFFENAFLEGNTLLIGNMDSQRIGLLKGYIRDGKVIPMSQFLVADSSQFLVRDMTDLENSTIHYLQSWAIVYFLSKRYDLSQGNFFAGYVQELSAKADPVQAFCKLTQQTVTDFDRAWQQDMLQAK